ANVGVNGSKSSTGGWLNNNDAVDDNEEYGFHGKAGYAVNYEPWYFKFIGEVVSDPQNDLDYAAGTDPVRIQIDESIADVRMDYKANAQLENRWGVPINTPVKESYATSEARRSRNTVVQAVTFGELGGNDEALAEYKVEHYVHNTGSTFDPDPNQLGAFDRSQRPDHHIAGMTVSQTDGMRYVYGLPAYNNKHVEVTYTHNGENEDCSGRTAIVEDGNGKPDYHVNNTDEFYSRKELPPYAHSYLLTAVLGQDYVDADDIPGPSAGDLGYWVKFNYVKTDDDYQWRAPFLDANFEKGQRSLLSDDRGSYMYGEREQWYLATAETKTHIAEFSLERSGTRPLRGYSGKCLQTWP
ncbi:MAG: hypothetical protein AAF570_28075, partial [Bacteroidota bacterium]